MIANSIDFCAKLENKLSEVVIYFLNFFFSMEKNCFGREEEKIQQNKEGCSTI